METLDAIRDLQHRVESHIVGQKDVVEALLLDLLADGHLLLEGLPGLAKTRAVKSLARELAVQMSRIQFTPDLLPSDITGTVVYDDKATDAASRFRFDAGPLFANLVLVDEINRAPAKVQAALLEAMEERQVTAGGATHALPKPFMVLATQNPIEQEGTYALPEAQLDRFLMHVYVDYPDRDAELEILRLVRGEEKGGGEAASPLPVEVLFAAREAARGVSIAPNVEQYLVDLVLATRPPRDLDEQLGKWIEVGASPRATLGLDRCARAKAWLAGRDHVTPDDVRGVAHGVLRHRLILSYEANAQGVTANAVVDRLLDVVAVAG